MIGEAKAYAASMVSAAESAMSAAVGAVSWANQPSVGYTWANLPDAPGQSKDFILPTLSDVPLNLPTAPGAAPTFQDIPELDTGVAPVFSAVAPTPGSFSTPSQLAEFREYAPQLDLGAAFPSAPQLIVPEAPTMGGYDIPIAPNTVMPSFGGVRPADIGNAPSDLATTLNTAYHTAAPEFITMVNGYVDAELTKLNPQYHAQMARIETQLGKYLDGGTGLNPAVENAIYERARGKNNAEALRVRNQALSDAATRGFTLPTGALLSATQQARQAGADNNAKAAAEIVVMQAEMEQKNLQFAVTTSTGLRTAMVNATLGYMQNLISLNGQASAYAQSMVNAMVETYNATVRAYSARLEGYKADASVFQSLIQAALAGVEVYKAEIQALTALTQVDMARVNVYKARIDVLTSLTGMYRTQVEAAVSKASLERLKVDVFQAQVQAYGAQVGAKTAEWQGYTAQIAGDTAKVQAYGVQAQAYNSQVNGYKAAIDAQASAVQAAALTNDARAKMYTATLDGYKATVQAKGEVARTQLENQRQQVIAFQAETSAAVANAQIGMEYYKAVGSISVENAKLGMQSMIADVEAKSKYIQILATLHTANATVHANLAGAAMAGMNALAVESAAE